MLRIVQADILPASFIVDPSAEFQSGQCAQLIVQGNQVLCTVSNGTAPIGIIDDIKTKAFSAPSIDEVITVPAIGVPGPNNTLVTSVDIKVELRKPNILPSSFVSTVNVVLNPVNGVITFLAGTPLNIDLDGSGKFSGIRTVTNYTYLISGIPGDDSTAGSGRVTVWYGRMFFQTTAFETNQNYPLNANLYVSEIGLFTTRRPSKIHPAVAIVTSPPSSFNVFLEALWL